MFKENYEEYLMQFIKKFSEKKTSKRKQVSFSRVSLSKLRSIFCSLFGLLVPVQPIFFPGHKVSKVPILRQLDATSSVYSRMPYGLIPEVKDHIQLNQAKRNSTGYNAVTQQINNKLVLEHS